MAHIRKKHGKDQSRHTHAWLILHDVFYTCDMTYTRLASCKEEPVNAYVWNNIFICMNDLFIHAYTISHDPHMNEARQESVTPHICMGHITHMQESCHTHELVMAHVWMRHGTHMNASWHTYEWVMSTHKRSLTVLVCGEDAEDALSCRSLSAKGPLIIGLFCGKWPIKIDIICRHATLYCVIGMNESQEWVIYMCVMKRM